VVELVAQDETEAVAWSSSEEATVTNKVDEPNIVTIGTLASAATVTVAVFVPELPR
jgi:hypothetical protein